MCGSLSYRSLLLLILCSYYSLAQTALFNGCDHVYDINPGYTFLQSPYYPRSYPAGTSCRYRFVAPLDYEIQVECTIQVTKNPTGCSTEYFYVARDGDLQLRDAEQFCGSGRFVRKTIFRSLTLAYVSYATDTTGDINNFECTILAQPQPCDCGWSMKSRIRNGKEALPNEYPSMVALQDRTSNIPSSFCGASIISHYYILTAAHCTRLFPDPRTYTALVGVHDLSNANEMRYSATYDIALAIEHPDYVADPVTNDLSILRTTRPIEWSRGVGPICLPSPTSLSSSFAYQYADVVGWGNTNFGGIRSPTLQKVELLIAGNADCAEVYQDITPITQSQICTYDYTGQGRDSCEYDSGGPVVLRKGREYLVGCISFGLPCGDANYSMSVNTRITSYLGWIYQVTRYTTCTVTM